MRYIVKAAGDERHYDLLSEAFTSAKWARSFGYAAEIVDNNGTVIVPLQLGCD